MNKTGYLLPALLSVFLTAAPLAAQSLDEISLDARATFHQETRDGVYGTHFQGDYLNLHIKGTLSETISYRVRQRLNKDIEAKNPFKATDFLWIRWQPNDHWGFTFGKQGILVGGYEFDSPPIEVYYYSAFCNGMSQVYAFGATAHYTPVPGQTISLQFIPSPISPPTQNTYSYNLYWNGSFFPRWKTLWSVNLVEDEYHRKMNYIALGNKFFFGPLVVDVDYINRTAAGHPRFFSDGTVIGKAIYSVGKWNLCTKVGYEWNDAMNVDENGLSYDLVLPAGNNYLYYGAGVEYFPLGDETVRLHAVYFRDNHDTVNNFDIGVTWRMRLL